MLHNSITTCPDILNAIVGCVDHKLGQYMIQAALRGTCTLYARILRPVRIMYDDMYFIPRPYLEYAAGFADVDNYANIDYDGTMLSYASPAEITRAMYISGPIRSFV